MKQPTESKSPNAANTGDSGNGGGAARSAMAGPSQPSRKSGKPSTFRTLQTVTPDEAGQILLSALNYCMKAGLAVQGCNEQNSLILSIEGLTYDRVNKTIVTLTGNTTPAQVTPSTKAVTP